MKLQNSPIYLLKAHSQRLTIGILRESSPHQEIEHLYYGQSTEGRISYELSKVGTG